MSSAVKLSFACNRSTSAISITLVTWVCVVCMVFFLSVLVLLADSGEGGKSGKIQRGKEERISPSRTLWERGSWCEGVLIFVARDLEHLFRRFELHLQFALGPLHRLVVEVQPLRHFRREFMRGGMLGGGIAALPGQPVGGMDEGCHV